MIHLSGLTIPPRIGLGHYIKKNVSVLSWGFLCFNLDVMESKPQSEKKNYRVNALLSEGKLQNKSSTQREDSN